MMTITEKINGSEEDRLRDLPNEILHKILSCLTIKERVRTGILSTRWKSVWPCMPILDSSLSKFIFKSEWSDYNGANEILVHYLRRSVEFRPEKIMINVSGRTCEPRLIFTWIQAALDHNVTELQVRFSRFLVHSHCNILDRNLFAKNKLVVLKLSVDMDLCFPVNSLCFPNLRDLALEDVLYKDDATLSNLISSCPVLQELIIIRSRWDNLVTLNIESRSLLKLKVNSCFRFVKEQVGVLKMVIDAPNVYSVDISCFETQEYVVKDLSRIAYAKVDLSKDRLKFLRNISSVRELRIEACTFNSLAYSDSRTPLPFFYKLTNLNIYSRSPKSVEWRLMLKILRSMPVLEVLKSEAYTFSYPKCNEVPTWDVPNCVVLSLKTLDLCDYSPVSLDVVVNLGYLLRSAKVLKKITVTSSFPHEICPKTTKKLTVYPKTWSSALCRLRFEQVWHLVSGWKTEITLFVN